MIGFSILINGLFLNFSKTLGVRSNTIDDGTIIRWGSTSKPAFGGISFYILFLVSFVIAAFKHYEIATATTIGILIASSLGFMIGLADDAYNTKPLLKFLGQLLCAIILVLTGTTIDLFDNQILNIALTIFWVVGMMNSINMLDNMDAITTSVSIFICLTAAVLILIDGNLFASQKTLFIICIVQVAALIGFLYFNWNPSRMYMGDTGSQFLGVLLAAIGIILFWNGTDQNWNGVDQHYEIAFSKKVLAALLVFILPIIDTTTVTINRLMRGQSPFVGGKDHTTHHLSYAGLTDRHVAIVFCIISAISLVMAIAILHFINNWNYITIALFSTYCILLFSILFYLTKRKKKDEKK